MNMRTGDLVLYKSMVIIAMCVELLATPVWAAASELALACAYGDVLAVRRLLDDGANPDEIDEEGYTPLLRAVFAGHSRPLSMHLDVINLLIDAGADVNARVGGSPVGAIGALHKSVSGGAAFLELTLLLLENGADPDLDGEWGRPLHVAAASGKAGYDEVKLLLDWGANAKALNQRGLEPLVEAVTAPSPSLEKITLLVEAGANVNAVFDWNGHNGLDALMAAAMNGTEDIVKLLLYNGALKYSKSDDGLSAYDYAVKAGRADNALVLW